MRKTMLTGLLLLCMAQTQAKKIKPQVVKPDSATCQENALQLSDNPITNTKLSKLRKPTGWFSNLVDWVMSPVRPVWGQYSEGGSTNLSAPLASADRNIELHKLKDTIIKEIKLGQKQPKRIYEIYEQIYKDAQLALGGCSNNAGVCVNAMVLKNAAFVCWLGVDIDGNELSLNNRIDLMNKVRWGMHAWADEKAGSYSGKSSQIFRAKENIMLIQAYHFLDMASAENAELFPNDARNSIREEIHNFTYELYSRANNPLSGLEGGALLAENNMTLIVAAAVGMGAIAVSQRRVYLWQNQQKPDRWANAAHAYLKDVMWSTDISMGDKDALLGSGFAEGPHYFRFSFESLLPFFQSFKNFTSGSNRNYGPYYKCTFCFDAFHTGNYYADSKYLKMYDWYNNIQMPNGHSPTIDDTYSSINKFGGLSLTGLSKHSIVQDPVLISPHTDLKADYLSRNNYYSPFNNSIPNEYINDRSGDMVVRNGATLPMQDQHYLHLNVETFKARNGGDPKIISGPFSLKFILFPGYWEPTLFDTDGITKGHEHADIGNFIIAGGEDVLAMDPPYFGDKKLQNYTVNKGEHHNVITINGKGPNVRDETKYIEFKTTPEKKTMHMHVDYKHDNLDDAYTQRTIEVYNFKNDMGYYEIHDRVGFNIGSNIKVSFNLNGNGHQPNQTFYILDSLSHPNTGIWNFPCHKDSNNTDNWKMEATITGTDSRGTDSSMLNIFNNVIHGNNTQFYNPTIPNNTLKSYLGNFEQVRTFPKYEPFGLHTRATKDIYLNSGEQGRFHAIIRVLRCTETDTIPPYVFYSKKFGAQLVSLDKKDSLRNFHFSRNNGDSTLDSLNNPFLDSPGSQIKIEAQTAFFSRSKNPQLQFNYCITNTHFRSASMHEGTLLAYRDTTYLKANKAIDAYYKLTGRYKYEGYVNITNPNNKGTKVSFLLPDLDTNQIMVMTSTNNKSFGKATYHKATRVIENTFDTGLTHFVFELADPCQQSCFFPQVPNQIDDTFDFGTGGLERLGRDLDILPDSGWLNMTNGSKISICEGFVLVNQDSITMVGALGGDNEEDGGSVSPNLIVYGNGKLGSTSEPSGTPAGTPNVTSVTYLTSKDTDPLIYGKKGKKSQRCMIIINNKAALVLDSGSRTHIGANSTILVRKGGTLLIKKHAFVEIGSKHNTGMKQCFGEILAEDSAFVCIEDSSDIHFFINHNDSSDKNRFYVTTYDSLPVHHKTYAYVNIDGARGKFKTIDHFGDSGRFRIHNCVNFCSLKSLAGMAPDGINNRHFGWSNINRPSVRFNINDTFCLGDGGYIFEGEKSLNETWFKMRIDRIRFVGNSIQIPPVIDTISLHEGTVIGANTDITMVEEVENFRPEFEFDSSGLYRVRLRVYNSCPLEEDEKFKFFHVRRKLNPNLKILTPEICPGIETLEAADSTYEDFQRYGTKWHIHLIDTTDVAVQKIFYGQDWEFEQKISPFNFPGFNLIGGVRYAISLTITNECGTFTKWDTVLVKPGAFIELSAPRNFAQEISTGIPVQLNAYIPHADTFAWNPTTYLDTAYSRHPIATPTEDMQYVLTAYSGNCVATDTAIVKYNQYASAGYNDTLCNGTAGILIGNPYDMSLFLACAYAANPSHFSSFYQNAQMQPNPGLAAVYSISPKTLRHFSAFMRTDKFKIMLQNCNPTFYNYFINNFAKKEVFKNNIFINQYFTQWINPSVSELDALAIFDVFKNDILNSADLAAIAELDNQCTYDVLQNYFVDFLDNNSDNMSSVWLKTSNNQSTIVGNRDLDLMVLDAPTQTTKYSLSVIADNKAELDEITIFVDSALSPLFYPVMQFDSTAVLQNYTNKSSSTNTFEWNFGDGSPHEFTENVMHTFPAFDSNYVVCLTATNKCGSQTYCDTVRIDSVHLGGINKTITQAGMSAIPSNPNSSNESQKLTSSRQLPAASSQSLISLTNYPNPFNQNTVIAYQIWQKYQTAELRITNIWGQELITQKLNKPIDYIQIDGSTLADGLYYYSIVVDGRVAQTKTMSVIK